MKCTIKDNGVECNNEADFTIYNNPVCYECSKKYTTGYIKKQFEPIGED